MCNRVAWLSIFQRVMAFLVSALILYVALEWSFPRIFCQIFSLDASQKFEEPTGMWPLLQTSKKSFLPQNYIALAGDSYVVGMGDAFYSDPDRHHPRFHSAFTIQDLTGKDVIAYGAPGSGSVRGMISNPIAGETYIRKLIAPDFPEPAWLLLYFYEGNDLTENWMYYEKTFLTDYAEQNYSDPQVFDNYVQEVALNRHHLYQAANAARFSDRLFFRKYLYRFYVEKIRKRKFFRRKYPGELGLAYIPEHRWQPKFVADPVNKAVVGGQAVALPDNLQGPSMDLSQEQLEHAVGSFSLALNYTKRHFPSSKVAVIYIPSVLSTYQIVGNQVYAQNFLRDDNLFSTQAMHERSDWTRRQIANACATQGVPFVDTSEDIRAAARQAAIHGPNDWNHLSKLGYEVLGQSVVKGMEPYWKNYIQEAP